MEGEEAEWRKVEEFRGLLEAGDRFETESEEEEEEEEVLHIRAPSTRTKVARKKEKYRPPPLNLGNHTNPFTSPSSFSPDTVKHDGSITQPLSSASIDPLSKEIERRRTTAKDGKRVLRGKKSVGERLRGLCGIAV